MSRYICQYQKCCPLAYRQGTQFCRPDCRCRAEKLGDRKSDRSFWGERKP